MRALLLVLLATAAVHAAPALRLPDDAKPLRYRVALSIDPHAESFAGSVDVELDVRRAVDTLWLDATELTIEHATFVGRGPERIARVLTGDPHFLGFAFDAPLPVGKARLHVEYHAPLSATQVTGGLLRHVVPVRQARLPVRAALRIRRHGEPGAHRVRRRRHAEHARG